MRTIQNKTNKTDENGTNQKEAAFDLGLWYENPMKCTILDGKTLSLKIQSDLKARVEKWLSAAHGGVQRVQPMLATILVGEDPASATYVKMKGNACRKVGLEPLAIHLPQTTSTAELLQTVRELNEDARVYGILLQHPVPDQIDERACFDAIQLNKDVDGVTSLGFGKMALGQSVFGSATPKGIMTLLEHYGVAIAGKHAVVVGRSPILGKPMAMMLLNSNATVTVCHSKTGDLPEQVRRGDLVVGAVGKPEFIRASWIKDGAVVIDAGYHPGGKGDIEPLGLTERCLAYTPVPGGVGPMTIATLISQTVDAMEQEAKLPPVNLVKRP